MERRSLGKTGLETGVIGMGTWNTFDVPPSSTAQVSVRKQIVDEAIGAGVNFVDSSPMYGWAEQVLGSTLDGRRGSVLVATKVWASSVAQGKGQIERALGYFGGYVDVYQVHNLVSWREYLPILHDLRAEGTIRAVGITHYASSAFPEMRSIMETQDVQTVQIPYNAADTQVEREILPLAAERGIGVIVMVPLGTGELVRESPSDGELEEFRQFGVETWAQILLKWVVSDPRVAVVIPATSRPGRMAENARAGNPPFFGPAERERVTWLARRLVGR